MRLCVISGAAAKRALTLHCGRRAQALSRVDVPRTQAVEFGSKPGAINLFVYMQFICVHAIGAAADQSPCGKRSMTRVRARRRHGRAFHALKTPARPDAVDRAVGGAAAVFLPQGLQSPVRAATFPQHRGCRPERRQRLCCSNSEAPKGPAAAGCGGTPIQISIGIGLLADAVNFAPCRPREGCPWRHQQ